MVTTQYKNMKIRIVSLAVVLMFCSAVHSQYALEKGKAQINLGSGLSGWGTPVYGGVDFGIHKDISLGVEASYRFYNEKFSGIRYKHSITGVGVNCNYHFNNVLSIPKSWDLYAGINAGYYFWSSSAGYPGKNSDGTGLGGQIGGRYYFNDKIAINLEAGSGSAFSGGKLGLTFKL